MTVNTDVSSLVATGIVDGVAIAVPFPVQATTDLVVTYGADIVAVLGTHYTVALDAPDYLTASVTPVVGFAALSGGTIAINRVVALLQTVDIPTLATLASSRLEQICDRLTFMAQQLRDRLNLAISYPATDPANSIGAVPVSTARAGKLFGWDVNGKPAAVDLADPGALVVSTFGRLWVNLASAASGLTTLGFAGLTAVGIALTNAANAAAARAEIDAVGADDDVAFTGDNTFAGASDFTDSTVTVATAAPGTNTAAPASTAFVKAAVTASVAGLANQATTAPLVRSFTVSGSYAPTAGTKWFEAEWKGGGGGGGGNADGSAGGDTTFDAKVAKGGKGGAAVALGAPGGAGGTGGTGGTGAVDWRRPGGAGGSGSSDGTTFAVGGGGAGPGGGVGAGTAPTAAGAAAGSLGAGGGGAINVGGAGGGGEGETASKIYTVTDPAATFAFTIGAGGGTAAAGSSGYVKITEHYNF